MDKSTALILWFDQVGIEDTDIVGGKNASLGEMYRMLTPKGVKIPNGFTVTAHAYRYFIENAGIKKGLKEIFSKLDVKDVNDLAERGKKARQLLLDSEFPKELNDAILEGYKHLCIQYGKNTDVAVRSSATAEDLPGASFAGQQETYLNIKGDEQLLEACKKCFASLFTNRAISYRVDKGFDQLKIALSIGVQKMVRSDKASSGVIFTLDTESGFRDVVYITAGFGLGENIVQGKINPDEYYVFKPTMRKGFKAIISKSVGSKKLKLVYDEKKKTRDIETSMNERKSFCLNDDEILTLAKWSCIVEEHYTNKHNRDTPMDLEWAKDGVTNELFILQARPETVHSQKEGNIIEKYVLKEKGEVIVTGSSVGEKIGQGCARVIRDVRNIKDFRQKEVLVTDMTDPDWEPIMKIASAIVTNRGGRSCHAAIVSRELGIPCIVGTSDATSKIKAGQNITVDCSQGEKGFVYNKLVKFEIEKINLKELPETKTHIMMNLGEPEQAFKKSFLPNSGVGLAREEFIINSYIRIHPMALINPDKVKDKKAKSKINELTFGYKDKTQFFVDKLAYGIAIIGAAFYPKDVIVRFSDFKSNEYANLIGGKYFEPTESNSMIGWRGASRYYSDNFRQAFALECRAIIKVRNEIGLNNVKVMIPFCRTLDEGKKVIAEMIKNNLRQGENGLEVYVMCEIPSNVVLADQFSQIFDGFSIGSNDLTQLTLGLDRDSELVSSIFDERNEAVKRLVSQVIDVAKKNRRKIGICGDAPSTFPDFARFLVNCGIDSMSLTPDVIVKTILIVAEEEKRINSKGGA